MPKNVPKDKPTYPTPIGWGKAQFKGHFEGFDCYELGDTLLAYSPDSYAVCGLQTWLQMLTRNAGLLFDPAWNALRLCVEERRAEDLHPSA